MWFRIQKDHCFRLQFFEFHSFPHHIPTTRNYPPESAAGSPLVVGAWPNEGTKLAELLGGLQLWQPPRCRGCAGAAWPWLWKQGKTISERGKDSITHLESSVMPTFCHCMSLQPANTQHFKAFHMSKLPISPFQTGFPKCPKFVHQVTDRALWAWSRPRWTTLALRRHAAKSLARSPLWCANALRRPRVAKSDIFESSKLTQHNRSARSNASNKLLSQHSAVSQSSSTFWNSLSGSLLRSVTLGVSVPKHANLTRLIARSRYNSPRSGCKEMALYKCSAIANFWKPFWTCCLA